MMMLSSRTVAPARRPAVTRAAVPQRNIRVRAFGQTDAEKAADKAGRAGAKDFDEHTPTASQYERDHSQQQQQQGSAGRDVEGSSEGANKQGSIQLPRGASSAAGDSNVGAPEDAANPTRNAGDSPTSPTQRPELKGKPAGSTPGMGEAAQDMAWSSLDKEGRGDNNHEHHTTHM